MMDVSQYDHKKWHYDMICNEYQKANNEMQSETDSCTIWDYHISGLCQFNFVCCVKRTHLLNITDISHHFANDTQVSLSTFLVKCDTCKATVQHLYSCFFCFFVGFFLPTRFLMLRSFLNGTLCLILKKKKIMQYPREC